MQYLHKGNVCQAQGTEQNTLDAGVWYYNLQLNTVKAEIFNKMERCKHKVYYIRSVF